MEKFNNPFETFFQKKDSTQDSIEKDTNFEAGEYKISVTFKNCAGEDMTKFLDFSVKATDPISKDAMEKEANDEINFFGLHNWGMDVSYNNYPDGHPVTINLYKGEDTTPTYTYVKKFDGSGRPVK